MKSKESETVIKGSLVFGILVLQPLVFAGIFLKILDRIFNNSVLPKVDAVAPISARHLEQKEKWLRRIGINKDSHKRVNVNEPQNIDISSIDKLLRMEAEPGVVFSRIPNPKEPRKFDQQYQE